MAVWTPNTRDPASRGVNMTSAPDGVIYLIEESMKTLNTGGIVRLGMIFHEAMNGLLGSIAPCVLYGSNAERLGSTPGTFATHCLSYSGLYLIGSSFFGGNCIAPCFSYPSRTAIRRKFNLEASYFPKTCSRGSCEALNRSCGCCGSFVEDDLQREQCESACDFATHFFCHTCALCQEGREIRRRVLHPGFNAQPVLVMIPPGEQSMGRGA
ncbi:hypothetical protein NC653_036504 [Populus alba x Populus x berolinensis]|uniref:Uncharacterized protein n=1 Tax=Populus alba x Populus x berolinensis TaxID=444605 RepID=A0AAD6PVU6_9ROSI|nr:hypothetical protein NC653_036504 [Populus alba x Populus x berolinensis]